VDAVGVDVTRFASHSGLPCIDSKRTMTYSGALFYRGNDETQSISKIIV
jgi:hypothetical protein